VTRAEAAEAPHSSVSSAKWLTSFNTSDDHKRQPSDPS
jgi:hypothetical protein